MSGISVLIQKCMNYIHRSGWFLSLYQVRKYGLCSELTETGFWSKHLQRARGAQSVSQLQEAPSGQPGPFPGRYTRTRRDASATLEARHGLGCAGGTRDASARLSQLLRASQLP